METDKYQIAHSSRNVIERVDPYAFVISYDSQRASRVVQYYIHSRDAGNLFA
jgi:hypothetical protein